MTKKNKAKILFGLIICCVIIMGLSIFLNSKQNAEARELLEESIKKQLLSAVLAAREQINVEEFISYNSLNDIENNEAYEKTLEQLRVLVKNVGAKYIYAFKYVENKCMFVYDTDYEGEPFTEYEIEEIYIKAFAGSQEVGIFNLTDEYGSFHTAAVPLFDAKGTVVGIVGVDIEDSVLQQFINRARTNTIALVGSLGVTLAAIVLLAYILLGKMKEMHDMLASMAKYDKLTSLPNRQFLLDKLTDITTTKDITPFSLFFIDLDNFKKVNDIAGHDAGDELLKAVGKYLQAQQEDATVFRPGSGALTVTARIGGDEFIVLMPHMIREEAALKFADRLVSNFKGYGLDNFISKYDLGLSIGIAIYPVHTSEFHVLIKYADIAMYHAKHAGKNQFKLYSEDMQPKGDK